MIKMTAQAEKNDPGSLWHRLACGWPNRATTSNGEATILKFLDIIHPASMTLVDMVKTQDDKVSHGTTSVTLMATEFWKQAKTYVEEGLFPKILI